MKRILFLALVFLTVQGQAQKYQPALLFGKEENRIHAQTLLGLPNDTFAIIATKQAYPHAAIKNNVLYVWNTSLLKWEAYNVGGSVLTKRSITIDNDSVMLVNDTTANAPYHLYGFNIAGRRGFYRPDTTFISGFSTMVRPLISLTTTGSSGAATYNSATGVFNIPQYSGGGGDSLAMYAQVWVDSSYGNDATGVVQNPAKPYRTINAALDATSAYPQIIVNIGLGTYDSITENKIRSNMWLKGSKQPTTNSLDTSTSLVNLVITRPTKLINGTIIQGGFQIRNKYNIQITDLGVDNGADRVAAGHRKYDCIDIRDAGTAGGATPPFRLMDNIRIENVTCLGDTSNSLYHALTLENCIDPVVKNVLLVGNTHGLAVKTVGGIYDGITSYWHTSDCAIFKINNYAPSHEMVLNNFVFRSLSESVRESGGLVFQNETGVAVRTGYVIGNGTIRFTSEGIRDYGNVMYNVAISNVTIHKTTNSGFYNTILAKSYFNNIIIDSTGGYGVWQTTTTGGNTFNSVYASNNTYGGFTIEGGTDKTYLYNCAANNNGNYGIGATDANVFVENYSAVSNSSGATNGTINAVPRPYLVSGAKSVVGATTAGVPYPLYIGSGLSIATGGGVDTLKSTGGGGSTVVSDSAWSLAGNTVASGIKYNGTINNRSVNFITNNTLRMVMDSVGNFSFNPGASAGYSYKFASYTDDDFFKIGYGNVASSGVTIGGNTTGIGYPRLLIQGYDNDVPLLSMGDNSASMIRFFRYSSNGVGMKATNNGNIPFTFGGGYAFKSNTYFGDSVLTTNTTAKVHIAAGTATASTAPLKFTTGTSLTTPEAGAMEYDGSNFFLSPSTTRKRIPLFTNATPGNGELLIGNGTDFTKATLASADGSVTITNGAGTIDLSVSVSTESTYTPTLTNTTNIAASTAYTTHYQRVGDVVRVWGTVDIDATSSLTLSEMGMSLPISTGLGQIYELAGTASFEDNTAVQIKGDVANGRAVWRFTPQSATNNKYSFHFTYKYFAP